MRIVDTSSKVRKERISISSAALADGVLIVIIFMLLGSKFILATGHTIDLQDLPTSESPDVAIANSSVDVLNAKGNSMIIFDGAIFNPKSFARKMAEKKSNNNSHDILLIKADKNVDTQTLLDICTSAKKGGFKKVHIATTKK
ncbi:MAG: biopolymer transporter ExbD [Opitutales bacterium]|nr:biopolymer transporter ExbD [Opitutales bacterium]MBP3357889.1 biopolymer transporter ExbD [Opitutales bacterium]MBQ2721665.1 biopolymer transporter ExbD [Opitutales bacterium]MBR7105351.1 biopolymer transporter ExbD [Opitutales bacterium]